MPQYYSDSNLEIQEGDEVNVAEPTEYGKHAAAFTGEVIGINREDCIILVEDCLGDVYGVEDYELELTADHLEYRLENDAVDDAKTQKRIEN